MICFDSDFKKQIFPLPYLLNEMCMPFYFYLRLGILTGKTYLGPCYMYFLQHLPGFICYNFNIRDPEEDIHIVVWYGY